MCWEVRIPARKVHNMWLIDKNVLASLPQLTMSYSVVNGDDDDSGTTRGDHGEENRKQP